MASHHHHASCIFHSTLDIDIQIQHRYPLQRIQPSIRSIRSIYYSSSCLENRHRYTIIQCYHGLYLSLRRRRCHRLGIQQQRGCIRRQSIVVLPSNDEANDLTASRRPSQFGLGYTLDTVMEDWRSRNSSRSTWQILRKSLRGIPSQNPDSHLRTSEFR